MLKLEMLPAEHGDALLLEYGRGPKIAHRILIDAGPEVAYEKVRQRLLQLPVAADQKRHLDLLIITHVDGDHIEGVIKLLQDDEVNAAFDDIWFNDWRHLKDLGAAGGGRSLGPEEGEFLAALLLEQERPWNQAFAGGGILVSPSGSPLPVKQVGDLRLTILSPTTATLLELRKKWKAAIRAAGFQPGSPAQALKQFAKRRWARKPKHLGFEAQAKTIDHSEANGSSIAVLAELGPLRLVLAGDAFPKVLRESLERWRDEDPRKRSDRGRAVVNAFKLPHHGSKKNLTPELMSVVSCPTYLVSTSGRRFYHPDIEAIQQLIAGHSGPKKPVVRFNYESKYTKPWKKQPTLTALFGPKADLELEE